MTRILLSLFLLAFCVLTSRAHADALSGGWAIDVGCPALGANNTVFDFSAAKAGGLRTSGGRCQRTPTQFTKVEFSSATGGTPWQMKFFALQTGDLIITPPIQNTEFQPIFSVNAMCPAQDVTVNWVYVQWDDGAVALTDTYVLGTAAITTLGGVSVTAQFDVEGFLHSGADSRIPGESCINGVTKLTGPANFGGSLLTTATDGGVFKTNPGKAVFYLPQGHVTPGSLGGKTFAGITFDSTSSNLGIFPNAIGDVRNVQGTSSPDGKTFTVQPYSEPETAVLDSGETAYADTISLTSFNSPKPGMMLGTVTRTGPAARCETPPCTGKIACIGRTIGGAGMRIICSGQSPLNNAIPYNITLFRQYSCPAGYVLVPKNNDSDVYDDFCVAKFEMKNVGGAAKSERSGTPWTNIDRETAASSCRALGAAYDLISNNEWQAIARNAEETYRAGFYENWKTGSRKAMTTMSRGHSDGVPAASLAADSMDDDHACSGTFNEECNDRNSPDFSQRRILRLDNGKVIWDFSGNVAEWVKDNNLVPQGRDGYLSIEPWHPLGKAKWGPRGDYAAHKNASPFGDLGFGLLNASGGAIVRGGSWNDPTTAGAFAADLSLAPTASHPNVGFRCVMHIGPSMSFANLGFSIGVWDAGLVTTGAAATSATFILANSGSGNATLGNPAFVVTGPGMSLIANSCPAPGESMPPNATCSLQIRFAPTAAGNVNGSLVANWISSGLSGPRSSRVDLKGVAGTTLPLSLSPGSWAAGSVLVGKEVLSGAITLANPNASGATLGSPAYSISGTGMSLTENNCPAAGGTLAGNSSCTFKVKFAPGAAGAVSGNATVSYTLPGLSGLQTASVSVTGNGVLPPSIQISPNPLAFGNRLVGSSTNLDLTVANSGGLAATLIASGGLVISAGAFSLVGNTCGWVSGTSNGTVPPGGSCKMTVRFAPSAAGAQTATPRAVWTYPGASSNTTTSNTNGVTGTGTVGIPTITSSGSTGGQYGGGNTFTITGTNFTAASEVKMTTGAATVTASVTYLSATQLRVTAPVGPVGTVTRLQMYVRNSSGNSGNVPYWYTGWTPVNNGSTWKCYKCTHGTLSTAVYVGTASKTLVPNGNAADQCKAQFGTVFNCTN